MKRVAVTGMGIVSPCGNEPREFFNNLVAGQLGWRTTGLSCYRCRTICHALARSGQSNSAGYRH